MSADPSKVRAVIGQLLERINKSQDPLTDDIGLYGGGLQLDSLETAELSAMLEDAIGTDPFSAGVEMPETIGDIVAFYEPR